ncbi:MULTISPECIES: NEL-type E3 ubiquitin ligase domain-containing protein [unclassified Pseudomonas]|uniref:NEL-type E3 ubiquitin ligase domain-containing protein n=1 Tax=unclassified Pseudomonas TaxID=196821 RepID=UPI002448321C|nr:MULTISPECIES: NEL-type E3 ubiquitin ligase domain-containing protein [unclassified Pseudomonas]MDH0300747.1 NEL-type E3 ubiquitin ligase domain-containing protein [Pseudomonas sp. GD04091]MDH1985041.1 NEL-type E3 ubiquitin ligase domain-containing protein [Pseudomonas sp. GD03689]
MDSHEQDSLAPDPASAHDAFQDALIAARLPAWLRTASPTQVEALGEALTLSLYFRQRVSAVLDKIESIDRFAMPLLQRALAPYLPTATDVAGLRFRQGHREPIINAQPVGSHLSTVVYEHVPLITAALTNFDSEQASAGGQPPGNRLEGRDGLPGAPVFARLCRELDLGRRYQAHLSSILQAPDSPVASLIARSQRYAMLVDAHVARIRGHLGDDEHQLLVDFCGLRRALRLQGRAVQVKRLSLLGVTLEQIVVLDVRDERFSPLRSATWRVLVHVPGDPQGAWRAFPDLRHFANALGKHLRTPSYQRFFSRFVRRRDSQRFFAAVVAGYKGVSDLANIALDEHLLAWPEAVFDSLASTRIEQIKDDAAMIAVPTAAVDAQVRQAHEQRLAAEGWALLSLAGMFIPVVGVGLLAVTAWELLGEVFHGFEVWHEGDTSAALDHLMNVAGDLAVMALTAGGVAVLRSAWARASLVDSLVPARLEDGTTRLWDQSLTPFLGEAPPAEAVRDTEGVHCLGDQAWIEMAGHHYRVSQHGVTGRWRLLAQAGHAPRLSHNGAGAWRVYHEQPAQWEDVRNLFRRLGGDFARLDDEQIDQVLVAHGLDDDHLRALHVHARTPDAGLRDGVRRVRLDARIRRLVSQLRGGESVDDVTVLDHARALPGARGMSDQALAELAWRQRRGLFEHLYAAVQDSETNEVAALRRQFPRLPVSVAAALLDAARPVDRQRLRDSGRVALRLATAARAAERQARLARVHEGLFLDTPQDADLARAVLGLAEPLPGQGRAIRWRLFEGASDGPLLFGSADAVDFDFDLIHLNGRFQLQDNQGKSIGEPGELFEVLATAYDADRREALGLADPFAHNLRVMVSRLATGRRDQIAQALGQREASGWFQPPRRLRDGRIGYPLSGRSPGTPRRRRARSLSVTLREIYPSFTDGEVSAWLNDVRQSGRRPEDEIASLARELETLESHLQSWTRLASTSMQRVERRYFTETLINCWQRRPTRASGDDVATVGFRLSVWSVNLQVLPDLPEAVSFAHVRELSLMGLGLSEVPPGFLQAFPRLRTLELSSNQLTRVPAELVNLGHLRELDLYGNAIVLDASQAMTLGNCVSLEYINLSYNPLGRTFPLYRLDRLSRLHLRNTGISELPPALMDRMELVIADLRGNLISELPSRFFRSPVWLGSSVLLADNPLSASAAQRLQAFVQLREVAVEDPAGGGEISLRQSWLDAADSTQRPEQSAAWDELEGEPGAGDFFQLLTRLQETSDYQHQRRNLANRVFGMLTSMRDHPGLSQELFLHATEDLTCQDSVALCFSNLELRMLVWQASREAEAGNQEQALLRLGRRLWRLDEVDRIAGEDIQARRSQGASPDEIEIRLAYRVGLRDELDLPAQPDDMLFGEVAGVRTQQLQSARTRIEAAETTENLAHSLVARAFWEEHLRRSHGERFATFNAPFQERSTALMDGAQTLSDDDYVTRQNALRAQWDSGRRELLLALTRAALEPEDTAAQQTRP